MGKHEIAEQEKRFPLRFMEYSVTYGERFRSLHRHGSVHLLGKRGIWYVYPYHKAGDMLSLPQREAERIRSFWRFLDGERKYYPFFYMVLLRALRQVLWITKQLGDFELVCIPRSDPDSINPVAEVCSAIAANEKFILARAIDGSDLICRKTKMTPVHKGGRYTLPEIKDSIVLTRPLRSDKVILADDMVFTGKTIAACRSLLKENGAKRVYAICLYGYKRERIHDRDKRK